MIMESLHSIMEGYVRKYLFGLPDEAGWKYHIKEFKDALLEFFARLRLPPSIVDLRVNYCVLDLFHLALIPEIKSKSIEEALLSSREALFGILPNELDSSAPTPGSFEKRLAETFGEKMRRLYECYRASEYRCWFMFLRSVVALPFFIVC